MNEFAVAVILRLACRDHRGALREYVAAAVGGILQEEATQGYAPRATADVLNPDVAPIRVFMHGEPSPAFSVAPVTANGTPRHEAVYRSRKKGLSI
nr:hypothetical protein [Caballeronia novacaledonica]